MIVQGGLVQPLIKRIGERPALLTGLVCASIGMTWYGTAWEGQLVWLGIPLAAFGGLYNATSQSVMSPRVSALEPGQLQGGNSSIMAFAGILGPSVFASVFAKSIDTGHDFDLPGAGFWLAGLCLLLALLLARLPTR
jgi:DHA1 family tetracycline resistance protein-like MFS transporter